VTVLSKVVRSNPTKVTVTNYFRQIGMVVTSKYLDDLTFEKANLRQNR